MKNQLYFCALIVLFFQCCLGQTVRTITAGNFYDGLAVDSNSNVYCSNYAGTEVFKFNYQTEQVTTFTTGLGSPNGIGIGPNNEIYVCESLQVPSTGQGQIRIYNDQGVQTGQIANLFNPTNVQYRASDNKLIWVSYYGNTINLIDLSTLSNTVIATATTAPQLDGPSGIAFINGITYISNFNNRKIFRLNANNSLAEIAQLPAGAARNNFLGFITSDGSHIYGTQTGEAKIYKVDPTDGSYNVFGGSSAGITDGNISTARFLNPNGIVADVPNDRLYIAEAGGGNNLRIIENATLSINEKPENNTLEVFPNPFRSQIQLKNSSYLATGFDLEIHDTMGRLIVQRNNLKDLSTVDLAALNAGSYILSLISEKGIQSSQIIKL